MILGAEGSDEHINVVAVAPYRASIDSGAPLSERKFAAMFGKTFRSWPRHRMAEAVKGVVRAMADVRWDGRRHARRAT